MGVIEDKLKLLPTDPGVYVMLDADGKIIYVGKAKNLKNRVRQYFFAGVKTEKVMAMVKNVADFYYIIAPTETDALSLENNLIKKHKPRYNILLKDDKNYPYLRIDLKEKYPYFSVVRKIKKDGAKYFGPFMGGINVNGVLDIINFAFGLRPCTKKLNKTAKEKPCLNYHIKKCVAPCAFNISEEEYSIRVSGAIEFLNGDVAEVEKLLKTRMTDFAEREEFELALKAKEHLQGLEKIKQRRITALNKFLDADIVAIKSNGIYYAVNLLVVRAGRMLGAKNYAFDCSSLSDEEALSEFILRYYAEETIPDEIITAISLTDYEILEDYLKKLHAKSVSVICPKQGVRKQLADMAEVNATEHLETAIDKINHKKDLTTTACEKLKSVLNLKNYPKRMECFDVSNISGVDKVGSMVVFYDGEASKNYYRRFKIKTFEGADDYRSHQEMMRRRLERMTTDPENFPKPDLMVIDGGKGQLSMVKSVFDEFNITDIDLIALAERDEEIFTLNSTSPIKLPKSDYCLRMLQRIRDEAHRFAISYFKSLHSKRTLTSVLDNVKGLGKVKRKALIEKFKDIGGIVSAKKEDLMQVEGVGESLANNIIDTLTKEGLL